MAADRQLPPEVEAALEAVEIDMATLMPDGLKEAGVTVNTRRLRAAILGYGDQRAAEEREAYRQKVRWWLERFGEIMG